MLRKWSIRISCCGMLTVLVLMGIVLYDRPSAHTTFIWLTVSVCITAIGVVLMAIYVEREFRRQARQLTTDASS